MKKRLLMLLACIMVSLGGIFSQTADIRFTNTGEMYVASNGEVNTSLYVPASILMLGSEVDIIQNGRTSLGGDFVNDVTSGNIFDNISTGWYDFCGNSAQMIHGAALKQTNYINFPNVETFNRFSVSLDALMGMNVKELKLSEGKFVLKSKQDLKVLTSSQLAHLLVKDKVSYTRGAATPQQNGVVEIELYLGNERNKRFFGWSSPYKKTYSDYLFYNFLLEPTHESLFGDLRAAITNAEYGLLPGRGYLIGQDVYSSSVKEEWPQQQWKEALYEDRFKDMLIFNRYSFNDILQKTTAVASHHSDSYSMEELNTEDITLHLPKKGYHFLGNPYTCPLDMTKFVREDNSGNNPWGVTRGDNGTEDVYNMFWVISQGNAYNINEENRRFSINVTYLVAQEVGSTYSPYPDVNGLQIAPMQLFVVYANRELDFTIPKSERQHANVPFFRNATPAIDNELLLEVTDNQTKGFDRVCVVFRPGASLEAIDRYDASKIFNRSGGVNQIWLPAGNENLSVSVVPYETSSLEVAWQPSTTAQECTLTAYRQESLTAPEQVLIEDRQTGIITDLFIDSSYTFQSSPTDRSDRFVLHFKNSSTGIDNITESTLSCYYNKAGQEIVIRGLQETDALSTITVYDIQGRQIKHSSVGNGIIPFMATEGVYIVKVTGNRGLNAKITIL